MARLLLDECVDRRLRRFLAGHQVDTVQEMGWSARSDRDVLAFAAEAGFDAIITVDRNLSFQQRVDRLSLCVVVLHARSNRLADLTGLVPKLTSACEALAPGTVVTVSANHPDGG